MKDRKPLQTLVSDTSIPPHGSFSAYVRVDDDDQLHLDVLQFDLDTGALVVNATYPIAALGMAGEWAKRVFDLEVGDVRFGVIGEWRNL